MHAYYAENGWQKTADHFRISGSTMQRVTRSEPEDWKTPKKSNGEDRTGRALYLAAKSLERALMAHRRAGSPPSDIEHYAFFLLKEILK